MHDPLGLSIGTTDFVAVRAGNPPVRRRSTLTLFPHRPPQLGSSADRTDGGETGLRINDFVEHVGEREPLIAADGSTHRPELLLVKAIQAMVDAAGGTSRLAIGVPGRWAPAVQHAVERAVQNDAGLSLLEAPAAVVPDSVAALTAVHAEQGVAARGVVALLDFGGGGTSITLADASRGFEPIDATQRCHGFSGNGIDRAILAYIVGSDHADDAALAGTAMVADVAELIEQCRQAKERLSTLTATELVVDLPGYRTRIALTQAELEQLAGSAFDHVLVSLKKLLQYNGIDFKDLAAVVTSGGGANLPFITERLSLQRRVPVISATQPQLAAAVGATLCAAHRAGETRASTLPALAMTATSSAATVGTTLSNAAVDGPGPAEPYGLAWSQEDEWVADEPAPFVGEPGGDDFTGRAVPRSRRSGHGRRRQRLMQFALGLAALVATTAVAGLVYTLTGTGRGPAPPRPAGTVTVPAAPAQPAPPVAVSPSVPVAPPPPAPEPTTQAAPPPTAAAEQTSTAPSTTSTPTTTTPPSTTTAPSTTSTPTTTAPSTIPSEPTTTVPPTTSTVPMRTEYLTIPLVPIPIPIQVPAN